MAYEQKKEVDKRLNMPVDFSLLSMWAPCPTAEGKNSVGVWEMTGPSGDQIQFRVNTNDPVDKEGRDRGIIRAVLPNEIFQIFLTYLDEAIRSKGAYKRCIEGLNWWGKDGRLPEPRTDWELFVGKDEAGVMFMSLCKYKRPKIVFDYAPSRKNFRFKKEDGSLCTDAEESVLYARAHLKLLTDIQSHTQVGKLVRGATPDLYKPAYVPKPQGGGGGQGGGNAGYSNSGSTGGTAQAKPITAASYDEEDEIPY